MSSEDYLNFWNNLYSKQNYFGSGPTKLAKLAESTLNGISAKILEVGCGQGRDALYFAQLGYDVDAFDISKNAIDFINKINNDLGLDNLNAITHDIQNRFPYKPESFDFVYSNLTLQFFELQKLDDIFNNISNTLKKDSLFLFSTKKEGDKYYNFGKKINDYAFENKGIIRYFYPYTELKNLLSKYFDIITFDSDEHVNLDNTTSVWWKILLKKSK